MPAPPQPPEPEPPPSRDSSSLPSAGREGRGRVVLVATPIGNLGDLSPRAERTLAAADVVACEDTRVTRRLLTHAGISANRLVALHEHNEAAQAAALVAMAEEGKTVALVTDAGMPGISDPGTRLVAAAAAAGVDVEVVPGPSAAVAALVVSGLPTDRFGFEGFLPRKGRDRAARLAAIAAEPRTVVLFEAPHRVRATIADLAQVCGGERAVALARELTKIHEQVWRGDLQSAVAWLDSVEPRGEYVVVVGPAPAEVVEIEDQDISDALAERLAAGDDRKAAVAAVTAALGVPKRRVYEIGLQLRDRPR